MKTKRFAAFISSLFFPLWVLFFLLIHAPTSDGYPITQLRWVEKAGIVQVEIHGSAPLLHHFSRAKQPPRLVFDFPKGEYPSQTLSIPSNPYVKQIRVGNPPRQNASPLTRVVLDLKTQSPLYTLKTSKDRRQLTIQFGKQNVKVGGTEFAEPNQFTASLPKLASELSAKKIKETLSDDFSKTKTEDKGPIISLKAQDVDIVQVLRLLAKKSGANLVPHDGVTGKVSVYIHEESFETALDLILAAKGFLYKKINNSYFIYPQDKTIEFPSTQQSQVAFEARIMEVAVTEAKKLGFKWGETILGTLTYDPEASQVLNIGDPVKYSTTQVTTTLNLMESKDLAKTLANPRITTLNNKPAKIHIGDEIPYITTTKDSAGNTTQTVTIVETGIKLEITPNIEPDGYITVNIIPEVSFIFTFRGTNNDVPQVRTRKAESTVRIKEGETVVLGGLLNSEDKEVVSRVPILGQIPLLGNLLFTSKTNEKTETDLIITITPHLVRN